MGRPVNEEKRPLQLSEFQEFQRTMSATSERIGVRRATDSKMVAAGKLR
jgi:hypothetical protein